MTISNHKAAQAAQKAQTEAQAAIEHRCNIIAAVIGVGLAIAIVILLF